MRSSPVRGRVVAAVVVSVGVHALIGAAWLVAPRGERAAAVAFDVTVEGPDDGATTVTLREPVAATPPAATPRAAPKVLPPEVVQGPAVGPVRWVGESSPEPGPTAPPAASPRGAKPLHGRLRAGKTIVYLLDRSASMGPDGLLPRAAAALRASLEQLGPDTRFQIVGYNGGTSCFAPTAVAARPEAVERAGRWLDGLTAEGRSDHRAGFVEALAAHPDAIVLLTDADDLDESDVRAIRSRMREPVYLSVAVFGGIRRTGDTPLDRLARATGGAVRYVER